MENIKGKVVSHLQAVKQRSGKSFTEIAQETGLTNVYIAQLFKRQSQLKPETASKLRAMLPELPNEVEEEMMKPPMRSYNPNLIQEPTIYRLNEAVMHFRESIKEIINEEFGDVNGLVIVTLLLHHLENTAVTQLSNFYCSVDKVKGADGKDRVVLTLDGKYLPYTEQKTENMASRS
ncbi:hypothetical protein MKX01_037258 [Papaver californicum]|nr:hypothetical protein MKX01_037258 [Papaver californicum]